ncbi:MAG TPA: hypothetical protein VFO38_03650 [Candidatus Saccharimonadales bacterium]|nr:hypothetical protein [Candidatus Saccharimonadales bacterium]
MVFAKAFQTVLKEFLIRKETDDFWKICQDVVQVLSHKQLATMLLESCDVPGVERVWTAESKKEELWADIRYYCADILYYLLQDNPYVKYWVDTYRENKPENLGDLSHDAKGYFTQFPVYKTLEASVPMTAERAVMAVLQGWTWQGDELHKLFGALFRAPYNVSFPPDGELYKDRSEPGLYVAVAYGVSQILLRDPDIAAEEAARLAG